MIARSRPGYAPRVARRSRRLRLARALAAVAGLYIVAGLWLRPASPIHLPPSAGQPRLWRGAYHVHSNRSDGSGTPEQIAGAAAAAGLHFVILTDHGNGTRRPDPPRYVDGVLLLDGVEISTDDGHYVALGMRQTPFPLGGDGASVAADVVRFGGLGIIAHPDSPRPALAWHDPSVYAHGFEWLNADNAWRGANTSHLLLRLVAYPFNRPGALAGLAAYPATLFARYDAPPVTRDLALAAVDAHARIGWRRDADPLEGGRTLARFPSYRAMFGTFGIIVPWVGRAPSGNAQQDADAVMHALRERLVYSAVFSMADTPYLSVEMEAAAPALRVRTNAPADAVIRMRRNGVPWREAAAPEARFARAAGDAQTTYRAEVWLAPRRGWPALPVAVGQSIGQLPPRATPSTDVRSTVPVAIAGWHGEHDPASSVHVETAEGAIARATLTLAPGPRASQFAALVADLGPPPAAAVGLSVVLEADAPMRLSLQFREPRPGEGLRWRRSVFVGPGDDDNAVPLSGFRPIAPASGAVPLDRVHALLFVMDTVNAQPGDRRIVTVRDVRWIVNGPG